MTLLQRAWDEFQRLEPAALIVIALFVRHTIIQFTEQRRQRIATAGVAQPRVEIWKEMLKDTLDVVVVILCLAIVRWVTKLTLAGPLDLMGVSLPGVFEISHLAVALWWLERSLLRFL